MSIKYTAQSVIDIALAEEGYLEKASDSQLSSKTANAGYNNHTKYADYIDKNCSGFYNGKKCGFAWCDVFNDWCHIQAAIKAGGTWHDAQTALYQQDNGAGAGCPYSWNYYAAHGRTTTTPSVGAQIFFLSGSEIGHTGIVYKVDSSYVYTIEGNTSSSSGVVANGGGVFKKQYARNYAKIKGYGLPNYATSATATSTTGTTSTTKTTTTTTANTSLKVAKKFLKTYAGTYAVTASALYMRCGENKDSDAVIEVLHKDNKVQCYGYYNIASDGHIWLLCVHNNNKGYVSLNYLKKQ